MKHYHSFKAVFDEKKHRLLITHKSRILRKHYVFSEIANFKSWHCESPQLLLIKICNKHHILNQLITFTWRSIQMRTNTGCFSKTRHRHEFQVPKLDTLQVILT